MQVSGSCCKIKVMKTTNRKLIGIAAIVAVAVCIAAALVIFSKGSSTKRGAAETDGFTEEAATVDRVLYADEMAAIEDAAVGDIVYFGSYEQDNDAVNGTEPVEWYVLDKADGEATLLAVHLLDCQQYHEADENITWENCTLRSWLNGEFYNTAFSEEEQAAIVNTNVINEDNSYWGWDMEGGNDTEDKVWLLSLEEIERYFHIDMNVYHDDYSIELKNWYEYVIHSFGHKNWYEYAIYCYGQDNRVCANPTAYAVARGVGKYSEADAQNSLKNGYDMSYAVGCGWWWLRSPGDSNSSAAFVGRDGNAFGGSHGVNADRHGVRPALKVVY